MKNFAPLFIAMIGVFSTGCIAQEKAQLMSDNLSDDELVVVSYHVEERVNMKFGSYTTTYNVSNLNLISKAELGPDNIRIVTPKYTKVKVRAKAKARIKAMPVSLTLPAIIGMHGEQPKAPVEVLIPLQEKVVAVAAKKEPYSVDIDILGTYERILDKGYQSVDMLKRVGNNRFFGGDLVTAAKWYTQLFALTDDLEAAYYYRYAQALRSISQIEKANEMMELFEHKNM